MRQTRKKPLATEAETAEKKERSSGVAPAFSAVNSIYCKSFFRIAARRIRTG
jgi:hypothetical protein